MATFWGPKARLAWPMIAGPWTRLALTIAVALGVPTNHGKCVVHAEGPVRPTTVALTASRAADDEISRDLVNVLLPLTQVAAADFAGIEVVERQELDLALEELALQGSRGTNDDQRARLGKILSADLLVAVRVERNAVDPATRRALLHIVEAKTSKILGLAVAPCASEALDETARQIAAHIVAVARGPRIVLPTVAVAPFDSVGRFDHLRHFEMGIRDLLTAALLRRAGLVPDLPKVDGRTPPMNPVATAPIFHVLQRHNLDDVLRELELLRSGLVDRARLPSTLPSPSTTFLVRGTIDERGSGTTRQLIVDVELWNAATRRSVDAWQFACAPSELEVTISDVGDRLAKRVRGGAEPVATPRAAEHFESTWLLDRALADLQRFRRTSPIDASLRAFPAAPRRTASLPLAAVEASSPLGKALLHKSVDRLETVLLLRPESVDANLALGACRSYHLDGIHDADAAEMRLRRVVELAPQDPRAAAALMWLAESEFHHASRRPEFQDASTTAARIWYAWERMPPPHRDARWARLPEIIPLATMGPPTDATFRRQVENVFRALARDDTPHRYDLAMAVTELLRRALFHARMTEQERGEWRERLIAWTQSDDRVLARVGAFRLAELARQAKDLRSAARWYLRGAELLEAEPLEDRQGRDNLRILAARAAREAAEPNEALQILRAMPKPPEGGSLNRGYYGFELGACYEALGDRPRALEAYLDGAERCPSAVDNVPLVARLEALGGVPLHAQRTIDVATIAAPQSAPDKPLWFGSVLATDGRRLFVPVAATRAPNAGQRIAVFEPATNAWRIDETTLGRVTALAWDGDRLWVGTSANGLWSGLPGDANWKHWTRDNGLPAERITAIACRDGQTWLGVGNDAAGGVARIDQNGKVLIEDAPEAPRSAPFLLVVQEDRILATCRHSLYEATRIQGVWWRRREPEYPSRVGVALGTRVFAGSANTWGSTYGHELFRLDATNDDNRLYQRAWFPEHLPKAGVQIEWVVEQGDSVWFGGDGRDSFNSCGLYRFDVRTKACDAFGPRDGIPLRTKRMTAGAWCDDQLWVLSSQGLARITPRGELP